MFMIVLNFCYLPNQIVMHKKIIEKDISFQKIYIMDITLLYTVCQSRTPQDEDLYKSYKIVNRNINYKW